MSSSTSGLDLDALEAEADDVRPPFEFFLGGRSWTAKDTGLVDWRTIAAFDDADREDPREVLRLYLDEDQYTEFFQLDGIPKWKVSRLMRALNKHYFGVSPGESDGSPTS